MKLKILQISFNYFCKIIKILVLAMGIIAIVLSSFAFTPVPYHVHQWLSQNNEQYIKSPGYLIMLGGSGMPSEENLIRLYYTAENARKFPESKIIISHPYDISCQQAMREELILRNIDSSRIFFEQNGTNTRSQVLNIKDNFPETLLSECLVINSPELMKRTIKAFRKEGFLMVSGSSAHSHSMFVNLHFNKKKLKGTSYVPDVGKNLALRYNFWNYLKLEITCLREIFALAYYKANGWI